MTRGISPAAQVIVLAQTSVAATVTGTLSETVLGSVTIPGGMMDKDARVRIRSIWSMTNNLNNKTIKAKWGATLDALVHTVASVAGVFSDTQVVARNSLLLQSMYSQSVTIPGTSPVLVDWNNAGLDMRADQVLTFRGTLANIADSLTLEAFTVELLLP